MDTVKVMPVIETQLTRRGDGRSGDSPIRIITQYWTLHGELLSERDPTSANITPEKRYVIQQIIFQKIGENEKSRELFALIEAELI